MRVYENIEKLAGSHTAEAGSNSCFLTNSVSVPCHIQATSFFLIQITYEMNSLFSQREENADAG